MAYDEEVVAESFNVVLNATQWLGIIGAGFVRHIDTAIGWGYRRYSHNQLGE